LKLGGKIYKECWNGRSWGNRFQLQCEKWNGKDRCWDPQEQEWEWENINENDGTLDGSMLTSIETDGLIATSASNGNIVVKECDSDDEESVTTKSPDTDRSTSVRVAQRSSVSSVTTDKSPKEKMDLQEDTSTDSDESDAFKAIEAWVQRDRRYCKQRKIVNGRVHCWTGSEWEWRNRYERDGTPDDRD
jgi:hypothetical protein